MKYIYCNLFFVAFISCKKEDEPAPPDVPNQQAPFGDNLYKYLANGYPEKVTVKTYDASGAINES
ncbi:hypothetical protein [Dyadobacter sp. 3J3]|uniref:hypothetical protein n=1 Tax=Dyadobacter sp. 3J3 TaxID=2606600 RepID=UPI00135BAE2C|nr:hypothetical protein [Dyadobacter sp. 3J3]